MQTMIGSIGSTYSTTAVPMGDWTSRVTVGWQRKRENMSKMTLTSQTKYLQVHHYCLIIWIKAANIIARFYCCHLVLVISQFQLFFCTWYKWRPNSGTHIHNNKGNIPIWLRIRNIPANPWSPRRRAICQAPPWHSLPTISPGSKKLGIINRYSVHITQQANNRIGG